MNEATVVQPQPDGAPSVAPDEHVHESMPAGSRYADDIWDYRKITPPSSGTKHIDFASIPRGYIDSFKVILLHQGRPHHPNTYAAGVIGRRTAATSISIFNSFHQLRAIAGWGMLRGLHRLSEWSHRDADEFVYDLSVGGHRAGAAPVAKSSIRGYVALLQRIDEIGVLLPDSFEFVPWPGRTATGVAGEVRAIENKTAPLPWETWAPLMAACRFVIETCGPTIVLAHRELREAKTSSEVSRGVGGERGLAILKAHLDSGWRVPLHTGFGRSSAMQRGTPNRSMVLRQLGINSNLVKPTHGSYRPGFETLLDAAVSNGQSELGGLLDTAGIDWIDEIGLSEAEYLPSVLRGACYIVISSLSGMRDSELQDIHRDALSTELGLSVLRARAIKHQRPGGTARTWWVPKVVENALDMLAQLTETQRLFARSGRRGNSGDEGSYDPTRDIRRLIEFVNAAPEHRPGRGAHLGLAPIVTRPGDAIHATSLRRTFAVYAATKPGAEVGLGIQLGKASLRATSGYVSDRSHAATIAITDERARVAREEIARLVYSDEPLAGPAGRKLLDLRALVIADPVRADRFIARSAENYVMGIFNDCRYIEDDAQCGPGGAKIATHLCHADTCKNAVVHGAHLLAIDSYVERLNRKLEDEKLHPGFETMIRKQRENLVRLRRLIDSKHHGETELE